VCGVATRAVLELPGTGDGASPRTWLDEQSRHPENPRSGEVLQRLGFRREGLLRDYRAGKNGREDRILFSVLPDELVLVATTIGR
jgi:hypothetical protein